MQTVSPLRGVCAIALLIALQGCVLVPALEPDKAIVHQYSEHPTLPNAVKVAESLRSEYTGEIKDQIVTERVTAIALISAAAVAADLAIRGVSKNDVLGLTLGAGALYTGVNFMVGKPQQYIYAAGANAVQCALDLFHPLRVAHENRDTLETLINGIDADVRNLDTELERFKDKDNKDLNIPEVHRGRALLEEAKSTLPVAREALIVLDNAGGDLYSSVGRIQGEVVHAIATNTPNLQSLMQQLGNALPTLGSQITGVVLPAIPESKLAAAPKTAADQNAIDKLLAVIRPLESKLAQVQLIIAAVQAKPSAEKLKTCSVDLQGAGLTMKVTPSGTLTMNAGQTASVALSGGVLPYQRASWIGNAPAADKVELTTETGAGIVTIKAAADAPLGTYTLLLRDSAQGRETVNVTIAAAVAKTATTPAATDKSAAGCTQDPEVKKIQEALVAKGIKTVKIGDETLAFAADGCAGKRTDAAMRAFLKTRGEGGAVVPDDALPTTRKELTDATKEALGL